MLLSLFCATQTKQQEWKPAKQTHAIAAEFCKTIKVLVAGIKYFSYLPLVPIMTNAAHLEAADLKLSSVYKLLKHNRH